MISISVNSSMEFRLMQHQIVSDINMLVLEPRKVSTVVKIDQAGLSVSSRSGILKHRGAHTFCFNVASLQTVFPIELNCETGIPIASITLDAFSAYAAIANCFASRIFLLVHDGSFMHCCDCNAWSRILRKPSVAAKHAAYRS